MKIKKLEICGFKSFVDRTVLRFDHDVTCVVGPNGCGKSNVVDAIRWAMGEQSAKTLRGRGMDDVIFAGSETRGPVSFAEVTLTFDNADQTAPPEYNDYPEIAVTRRLDRSGNSEYIVNKVSVRLMDVTNLFLGTGVGRKSSYSIVEQGRIGLIVSAKPEDRRTLIEEAAGITKFKAKKKAAERKMDYTQQNLLRITDIIDEIQKTLTSLKRQAQKAERYKKYRAEIRDLELWVASHRWLELTATHRVLRSQLSDVEARAEGARFALKLREAELETERLALTTVEDQLSRSQGRAYEADNNLRLLESQIQHSSAQSQSLRDREAAAQRELESLHTQREQLAGEAAAIGARLEALKDAEQIEADTLSREGLEHDRRKSAADEAERTLSQARQRLADADRRIARAEAALHGFEQRRQDHRARLARMEGETRQLTERVAGFEQEASELRARLEGLRTDKDAVGGAREQLEEELGKLRSEITGSDERVEHLRGRLAEKRSRLRSLEEIQQRFEGVGAGVRAVMTGFGAKDEQKRVRGLVADRFECPPELTRALSAALGERLQYVVVSDLDAGVEAVRYLSEGRRGRATLIPSVPSGERGALAETSTEPGVVGRLFDLVRVAEEDRALAEHLLGDVLVVEDLEHARALHDRGQGRNLLVTRDGQVLGADGSLAGGDGEDAGAHLLDVKREIRELRDEVATLSSEMDSASAHHGSLRNAIAQRQAALESTRSDAHERELNLVKAERDLQRVEGSSRDAGARVESFAREMQAIEALLQGGGDEELAARDERAAAEGDRARGADEVAAAEEVSRSRRSLVEEQAAVVTEVRVRAAEARQRFEGDRAAVERLQRSLTDLDAREGRLSNELVDFARNQGELAGQAARLREELGERSAEAMRLSDEVATLRASYDAERLALGNNEQMLREVRMQIDSDSKKLTEVGLAEREASLAIEHLLAGAFERHRVDVRRELTDYHDREIPDAATNARIDELRQVVERMGEINLTAIEEYEERAKRHDYLAAQKLDLETALEQLDKAIRQMNRQSRTMFRDAFDEVNTRFKTMFPKMFGGGRAELRLTNPEDLLETGIDIIAQPPGKKLTSIELMSGGEKALTAVSLIFSLFSYRPSPFCLLDEVDAPLDEANVGRYCEMIRSMTDRSQFMLISHHKTTMQSADMLYGVTMETPGISKLVSVQMSDRKKVEPTGEGENAAPAVAVA
jgi:chromosome segregation protein